MATPNPPQDDSLLRKLWKARRSGVSQAGAGGFQVLGLGPMMIVAIGGGYWLGTLLDQKFGVSYWAPALAILGLAVGFREAYVTLKSLTPAPRKPGSGFRVQGLGSDDNSETSSPKIEKIENSDEPARQRLFDVPAPPTPSFAQKLLNEKDDEDNDELLKR